MTKQRLYLVFLLILLSTPFYTYLYLKGMEDGIKIYKRSVAFMRTLEAAYNFGLKDGIRWNY